MQQPDKKHKDQTQAQKRVDYVVKSTSQAPRCSEKQNLHLDVARARFRNIEVSSLNFFRAKAARKGPTTV